MGEVEFFDKMKTINRLLTNEAREKIWNYILNGEGDVEMVKTLYLYLFK